MMMTLKHKYIMRVLVLWTTGCCSAFTTIPIHNQPFYTSKTTFSSGTSHFHKQRSMTKVVSPIKSLDRQRTLSSLAARRPILSEDDLAVPPNKKVLDVVEKMDNDRILASGR